MASQGGVQRGYEAGSGRELPENDAAPSVGAVVASARPKRPSSTRSDRTGPLGSSHSAAYTPAKLVIVCAHLTAREKMAKREL